MQYCQLRVQVGQHGSKLGIDNGRPLPATAGKAASIMLVPKERP